MSPRAPQNGNRSGPHRGPNLWPKCTTCRCDAAALQLRRQPNEIRLGSLAHQPWRDLGLPLPGQAYLRQDALDKTQHWHKGLPLRYNRCSESFNSSTNNLLCSCGSQSDDDFRSCFYDLKWSDCTMILATAEEQIRFQHRGNAKRRE